MEINFSEDAQDYGTGPFTLTMEIEGVDGSSYSFQTVEEAKDFIVRYAEQSLEEEWTWIPNEALKAAL